MASAKKFHVITRSHILTWRADLEHRGFAGAKIRRKLAILANCWLPKLMRDFANRCDYEDGQNR